MLLSLTAATSNLIAIELGNSRLEPGIPGSQSSWATNTVAAWASQNSVAANLIESERSATLVSIDREDRSQCSQAAMVQSITRDLECHERRRSAAQALTIVRQISGLQQQAVLLEEATKTLEQLLRFADKATELDIKDGNRFELDKKRLQVVDQQAVVSGAISKLQIALSQLISKSYDETSRATIDPPAVALEVSGSLSDQLTVAKANRCDLKAIDSLCRQLSTDTLPIARQWMSALQPGLGFAIASRKVLLASWHGSDHAASELCKRREQCNQLRSDRQRQIESEVHLAFIDYQTTTKQAEVAAEQLKLTTQSVQQVLQAIELDKAKPGSDLLAKLEQLEAQGRLIERQTAVDVAIVKLKEVSGTISVE